jgi:hypothetical protein
MLVLPLIVIGADDLVKTALEPYAQVGHIAYHPTAEAAHYALCDAAAREGLQMLVVDDELGWPVHVGYGPEGYGALTVGSVASQRMARLRHTGHTLILGHDIDPDPGRPVRFLGGGPAGEPPNTSVWQAAIAVSADHILDLGHEYAVAHLVAYLEWKSPADSTSVFGEPGSAKRRELVNEAFRNKLTGGWWR